MTTVIRKKNPATGVAATRPFGAVKKNKGSPLGQLFFGSGASLDRFKAHDAVIAGLPFSAVDEFVRETGFARSRVAELLGVPYSTFARRERDRRLKPTESSRLIRALRVYRASLAFMGGHRDAALYWMQAKNPYLGDREPLACSATEHGVDELEAYLFKVMNGVVV